MDVADNWGDATRKNDRLSASHGTDGDLGGSNRSTPERLCVSRRPIATEHLECGPQFWRGFLPGVPCSAADLIRYRESLGPRVVDEFRYCEGFACRRQRYHRPWQKGRVGTRQDAVQVPAQVASSRQRSVGSDQSAATSRQRPVGSDQSAAISRQRPVGSNQSAATSQQQAVGSGGTLFLSSTPSPGSDSADPHPGQVRA